MLIALYTVICFENITVTAFRACFIFMNVIHRYIVTFPLTPVPKGMYGAWRQRYTHSMPWHWVKLN